MRSRLIWIFIIPFVIIGFQYVFALISTPTAISGGPEAADGVIDTAEATDANQIQIRVYFNGATNSAGNTVRLLNGTTPANFTTPITTTMTATDVTNGFINFTLSTTQLPNGPYRIKAQINNATHISAVGPATFLNFTVSAFPVSVSTSGSGPDTKSSAISFEPPELISEEIPDLVINGESYFLDQYDRLVSKDNPNKIITQQVISGQPSELSLEFYSELGPENIQHVSIYPNMHGRVKGDPSETVITFDRDRGFSINDPKNLISDASINLVDDGPKVRLVALVDFENEMELSDLVINMWDKDRYSLTRTIKDFWSVEKTETADPEYQKAYANLQHKPEPQVADPIPNDLDKVQEPTTISEPKVNTQIFGLFSASNPEQYAKEKGIDYKAGQIRIALAVNAKPDTMQKLAKLGKVEASSSGFVQMLSDIKGIKNLIQMPEVNKIQIPIRAIQNGIVSEGVEFIRADQIQKKGTLGSGIKIAVLDLGFDTANPEIGKVSESKSFRYDFDNKLIPMKGFGTEYVHGTAVSEIITDVAPKSELYLYTFATEAEFLQAMDYAISKKVNMISMSAGWMNYPTDNTSPMTKKVEEAINKGIPFVVSSGNYAETHWENSFVDSDSDGWAEFSGTDEGLSFNVSQTRIANQIPILAYVMWNGEKLVDLNVVLTDPNGEVVASSSNAQKQKGDEFEYIYHVPTSPGTYNLGITTTSPKPKVTVEVFAQNDIVEYPTSKGSVSVPTDAKGVISVGAVNYANAKLEPFSSQGPTNNGKIVPSVVGPDAVQTHAYGSQSFYGTSAAQPHTAGIVALMLEKMPTLKPNQIISYLQDNADKKILPTSGNTENVFGHGKVNADFIEGLSKTAPKETKSEKPAKAIEKKPEKKTDKKQDKVKPAKSKSVQQQGITPKDDSKKDEQKEKSLTKATKTIKKQKPKHTLSK
ncbi:S8 family peptidase [Candidatus Nitrosotenuis cloacae]|uniref:S8 family peptidase n=1 Tax=Candidatus Nitrosotenuis cloacae TaxID=1603555 RepID=UPI00069BEECD|nr:S8 family serine peptidase [Candidatus Nitrosotenuis cloacae]